ncbi:MAG: hypothetical protein ACYDEP_06615 [Acidimicrobiales bacterium]
MSETAIPQARVLAEFVQCANRSPLATAQRAEEHSWPYFKIL